MPKFVNPHVKLSYADGNETLCLDDDDGDPTETMYEFRQDNGEACPYITDEFKSKLERLISIGSINTGCDNGWGALWIDTDTGKITAQDGGDEIHVAFDVCDSKQDVIQLWKRYVKLCKNPEFVKADPGFIDLLVWDSLCQRTTEPEDALWRHTRAGLRNVGKYHDSQYLAECHCDDNKGCNGGYREDEDGDKDGPLN